MEPIEIDVYESFPILSSMLNMSGFVKRILKKKVSWMNNKYLKLEFGGVKPGFHPNDVALINDGLRQTADFCEAKQLRLPSEIGDPAVYGIYAKAQIREIGSIIKLPYLSRDFQTMTQRTFGAKSRGTINQNGKPTRFTDANILEINKALLSMAGRLRSITLTV